MYIYRRTFAEFGYVIAALPCRKTSNVCTTALTFAGDAHSPVPKGLRWDLEHSRAAAVPESSPWTLVQV